MGVECTVFDYYRNAGPLKDLRASMKDKFGIVQYVRLVGNSDGRIISIEHLSEKKYREDLAIAVIEYDISGIRKKILTKLNKKTRQCKEHEKCLLIIDYRYFAFHPSALKTEWTSILKEYGKQYPKLIGVIIATHENYEMELTSPPSLRFVQNPHASHSPPEKLNKIKIEEDSYAGVKSVTIEVLAKGRVGKIDLGPILRPSENQVMAIVGYRGPKNLLKSIEVVGNDGHVERRNDIEY